MRSLIGYFGGYLFLHRYLYRAGILLETALPRQHEYAPEKKTYG